MSNDAFYLRVAQALSGCQLVEQELKLYIAEAFELVRKYVPPVLTFKMSGDDYEDASLERLIETFKKLSSNDALLQELNKFRFERNFLSHKAITGCLYPDESLDEQSVSALEPRLGEIAKTAGILRNSIHEEGNTFRAHLWFDAIS